MKRLPTDIKPFQPPTIIDMVHDGKKLMVEFKTFSKSKAGKPKGVMISVSNNDGGVDTTYYEEVKLNSIITAYYSNKLLLYNQEGITYSILYMNNDISKEQHKKEIIEIAKQMIK